MLQKIRLLIVDDHILFREGLASLFGHQPDFQVVGEAGSVVEAIELAIDLSPDLVLMDFSLGDGTGLDATRAILASRPETQIVFLTMHEDDDRLFAAIRSGAKGYLLKNLNVASLLASLRALQKGEAPLSPNLTSRILREFARTERSEPVLENALSILTGREVEIFYELARGASNREIAGRLVISENTVKNHVHNLLEKLHLQGRRDVMTFAARHGVQMVPSHH